MVLMNTVLMIILVFSLLKNQKTTNQLELLMAEVRRSNDMQLLNKESTEGIVLDETDNVEVTN